MCAYIPSAVVTEVVSKFPETEEKSPEVHGNKAVREANDFQLMELKIIRWKVAVTVIFSVFAIYGFYLSVFNAKWSTLAFHLFLHFLSGFGVTAGAHRLWSHRSYKARWPLRLLLAAGHTISLQFTLLDWIRMHRVHHKYSETDADPHDARRGFFFSHLGWVIMEVHPECKRRVDSVDVSDVMRDPIVFYQHKYYWSLVALLTTFLPTWIPWYFWSESFNAAFFVSHFRFMCTLNITFLVNSAAHKWGNHPYDKNISPTENRFVAFFALGEGWHNYHHVFPWDYKTSELGGYAFNYSTFLIDMCHRIGLAYDLKTVPESIVNKRILRTGDGTHKSSPRTLQ